MNTDITRWKELSHRAIDDIFEPLTKSRQFPGGSLSDEELKEYNELDAKLNYPSKKVIEMFHSLLKEQ